MSASNAMNRKVASARNESIPQYNTNYENNNVSNRRGVSGTPIQQLWTLANFHETRLARMDKFLEVSSQEKQMTIVGLNQHQKAISNLQKTVQKLEAELSAIKQHVVKQGNSSKKSKQSVTLEVTE